MAVSRRVGGLVTAVASCVLLLTHTQVFAQELSQAASSCRLTISREGRRFEKTTLKAWQRCLDGLLTGAPCDADARDAAVQLALSRFVVRVFSRCQLGTFFAPLPDGLGFPASCDLEPGPLTPAEEACRQQSVDPDVPALLVTCLTCWKQAKLQQLLKILYPCLESQVSAGSDPDCGTPPAACPTDNVDVRCLRATAKAGIRLFLAEEKALERCLDGVSTARITGPCPDAVAQASLATAERKTMARVQKCTRLPPWWDLCPANSSPPCDETIASVADVAACVDGAAEEIANELLCQQYRDARVNGLPCPSVDATTTTTTTTATTVTTTTTTSETTTTETTATTTTTSTTTTTTVATLVFTPSSGNGPFADGRVEQDFNGFTPSPQVDDWVIAGDDSGTFPEETVSRGFVGFDTSSLPAGAVIDSVILRLSLSQPASGIGDVLADLVDFGENIDVSDYDVPASAASIGAFSALTPVNAYQALDVTAATSSAASQGRVQFRLRAEIEQSQVGANVALFNAVEDVAGNGQVPQLVIAVRP